MIALILDDDSLKIFQVLKVSFSIILLGPVHDGKQAQISSR